MKKILLFLIITLLSVLSFIGMANAETLNLSYGYEMTLMSFDETHTEFTCSVTEGNISNSPFELILVKPETDSEVGKYYYVKYDKDPVDSGTVIITCNYKDPTASPSSQDKSKEYTLVYSATAEVTGSAHYSLDNQIKKEVDVYKDLKMSEFTEITLNDSDGILKKDCSKSKCKISLNPGYTQIVSTTITGEIKYKTRTNGIETKHTDVLVITVSGQGVQLITNGPGTCDTPSSSDWKKKSSGLYESKKLGTLSLPNCTPKTNYPLLSFAGWVPVKNGDAPSYQSSQTINTCAKDPSRLRTGSLTDGTPGYTYFACYVRKNGIIVNGNGNSVDAKESDGWVKFGAAGSYFNNKSSQITLPSVEITGYFSENQEALGWYNQDDGKYYQPGDKVPADGSTYIFQTRTHTIYRNYYKAIYVGEPYLLNPSDGEVTGCTSAQPDIIKVTGTGECILYGQKISDDYIDVTIYGKNDYQRVFHVNVVSRNNLSETGDEAFVINITPNVVATISDIGTLNSYFVDTCTDFNLSGYHDTGVNDGGGSNILGYKFNKGEGCSSNINYTSYCIDAGRMGPTASGMGYIKSETISMNSDFGKLITYMGRENMYTTNNADIVDVTTCIRIVGIIDNLSIASDFNINDKAHAASYNYYAEIAEAIVDDVDGKKVINPSKVDAQTELNNRVKKVLKNYQSVEDTTAAGFERQIEDIKYDNVDADGNYTVTFIGKMYVPGFISAIANPTSSQLKVLKRDIKESETVTDPTRTVYDFEIQIQANVNTLTLPNTATKSTIPVIEAAKDYCFKITVGNSKGMDAFMMEPTGAAAADGYQRMLTLNTSDLDIYVYFPPSPSINTCGVIDALNWESSSFNENLFRSTGCCNAPAMPVDKIEPYCSNWCISTTLSNICDYRTPEMYEEDLGEGKKMTADLYVINEGVRKNLETGTYEYKIGTAAEGEECIVKTENIGWSHPGMTLNSTYNKTDDAGNSLMVNTYKNNLYCRVSCSEEWQFSMQSFGNFVGSRAIAAGSYFQINDTDLFIGGKRTCYTTFINYGSVNGREGEGFTRDINIESNKIVSNYDLYSNLSHVYADIACTNDKEYSTIGGHTVKCAYSEIQMKARKFCYSYTTEEYCLTNRGGFDWEDGGNCIIKDVSAFAGYYCDDGDGEAWFEQNLYDYNDGGWRCAKYQDTRIYHPAKCQWKAATNHSGKCVLKSDNPPAAVDGACSEGYDTYTENGTASTGCYKLTNKVSAYYTCEVGTGSYDSETGLCRKEYDAYEWWTCSLARDGTVATEKNSGELVTPARALKNDMRRYKLHRANEITNAVAHVGEIGLTLQGASNDGKTVSEEEDYSKVHFCLYSYPKLKYNKCKEDGYGICINYYMSTSNASGGTGGIDDGDKTPEGAETGPGQYIRYETIDEDEKDNGYSKPVGYVEDYESVKSSAGDSASGFTTGTIEKDALDGYAYQNWKQASVELANDEGSSYSTWKATRAAKNHIYDKFKIASDPAAFCKGGSWTTVASEGMSYSASGPDIVDKGTSSGGGNNVIIKGLTADEKCDSSFPNCVTKQDSGGGSKGVYTNGNFTPSRFSDLGADDAGGTSNDPSGSGYNVPGDTSTTDGQANGADEASTASNTISEAHGSIEQAVSPCGGAENCDTDRGKAVRAAFIDSGFDGKLNGYAQGMVAANANINTYARDMFACQHFQLYNATDDENPDRTNNSQWSATFMGHRKQFVKIISSFEPAISYSYDEKEYMTILGANNVMERFEDLNDEVFGCYTMANRSGTHGCYNEATNQKKDTSIQYYENAAGDKSSVNVMLSRNYTVNTYYNNNNDAWKRGTDESISYGEKGNPGQTLQLTCDDSEESDCNIGAQIPAQGETGGTGISRFKRTILCTIGMVVDDPVLVSTSDGKTSGASLVYINDKDYFWTAGTCYVNQVQYMGANYVKASIENSSFYKNKGYWYVNTANDTKANGMTLADALENSNHNINSNYDPNDEEQLGRWSILGNYNVFPIKLTTPRDLYQYTYTFANIGSYGDGELGRVMGRDQSLVALNTRTCFYEVFEELCLCCGNPINAHVDSESPYIFVTTTDTEYEMSDTEPHDLTTATLAITTSNVSLSDMTSDNNRPLGSNWTSEATFFFNGDMFTTAKGADLLEKIESVGENAYSAEAEYRFTLNPEGLSHIREYNDSHIYGTTYEDLISIGRYAMNPYLDDTFLECYDLDQCEWDVDITTDREYYPQNRIINFTHYGSNFLMREIGDIKGITFSGKYSDYNSVGMSESCYVYKSNKDTDITSQLDNLTSNCRWVDYVQYDDEVERFFRLSFK